MKKNYLSKILLLLIFIVSPTQLVSAQELVLEMPFEDQVSYTDQIVEGKVLKQKAYWNTERNMTYTVSTVEVYKVFSGDRKEIIRVVTPGGFVEDEGMIIKPSLNLYPNDIGVFLLRKKPLNLQGNSNQDFYKVVGTNQGFYRYNILDDKFVNRHQSNVGIVDNLYSKITDLTNENIEEIKNFDVNKRRNDALRAAAPAVVTSISPSTITAGTKSILTLGGRNFGPDPGFVAFPSADDGGDTYIDAFDSHLISWSDTEIVLEVPSFAGTGRVRVESSAEFRFFSDILTVSYAHINAGSTISGEPVEFATQLADVNGEGGYSWFYGDRIRDEQVIQDSFERAFFNWVCQSGVNWTLAGNGSAQYIPEPNGRNDVRFSDNLDDDPSDGTVLAFAQSLGAVSCADGSGGRDIVILETDVQYNNTVDWYFGTDSPGSGQIDYETVTLHELGHAHQLDHIIDPGALMHFSVSGQSVVRDFEPNDLEGGIAVFERSESAGACGEDAMTQSACSLSTDDLLAESISIYPNPVRDILSIRTDNTNGLETITMFDALGRTVMQRNLSNADQQHSIDVSNLGTGLYFIELKTESGSVTKKIVVN